MTFDDPFGTPDDPFGPFDEQETTGIPPPPDIIIRETFPDPSPFDLSLIDDPYALADSTIQDDGSGIPPGGGGPPGGRPQQGACCSGGGCDAPRWSYECGGEFHGGEGCDSGACGGPPTEPTGCCCQSFTSDCSISTLPNCGGIYFGDNLDCPANCNCGSAFCGGGNVTPCACGCVHNPNACYPSGFCCPPPTCCVGTGYDICGTCYYVSCGCYSCCCCRLTPFGWVCYP